MKPADHVFYYLPRPMSAELERCVAHVADVIDADTVTLDVSRPGMATERFESVPRCDAATPTAGHWSTIP
jgi:hypothetical protein